MILSDGDANRKCYGDSRLTSPLRRSPGVNAFHEDHPIPADSLARGVEFARSQPEDMDINEIL